MRALIVESKGALARLWARHLTRHGIDADIAHGINQATALMLEKPYQILVIDLMLDDQGALAVADFASYRHPGARVIFVTNTSFFSDGSIFRYCANACAFVQSDTPPEDLVAMVSHYGERTA